VARSLSGLFAAKISVSPPVLLQWALAEIAAGNNIRPVSVTMYDLHVRETSISLICGCYTTRVHLSRGIGFCQRIAQILLCIKLFAFEWHTSLQPRKRRTRLERHCPRNYSCWAIILASNCFWIEPLRGVMLWSKVQ